MGAEGQTIEREDSSTPNPTKVLFECRIFGEDLFYSKKNSKTIGYRRRVRGAVARGNLTPYIRSSNASIYSERLLVSVLQNRARNAGLHQPICLPVHVLFHLQLDTFFTKKGTVNLKAGDLSNLIQGPEDALQKAGILKDDGLIVRLDARKSYGPNVMEIKILEAELTSHPPRK